MKKEERKAYDKAIKQYTEELNKINPIEVINRVDTNSKRTVEERLGDSASGRLGLLTKKADSLARNINKDTGYSESVGKFNDRYAILKNQMAGGYTTRFGVLDAPVVKSVAKTPGILNASQSTAKPMSGTANQSTNGFMGNASLAKKSVSFDNTYATQDEAMKAAQLRAEQYNATLKPVENTNILGMGSIKAPEKITANDLMQTVEYKGGASGRTEKFESLSGGYEDMASLSKTVQNSTGNANVGAYATLAEKIKNQYKRDAGNANSVKQTGLLSSELAGNPLAGEGIIG